MELNADDVGRWFRTRDGKLAVVTEVRVAGSKYPIVGDISTVGRATWRTDGKWFGDDENGDPYDIVTRLTEYESNALLIAQSFKDL